MTYWYSGFWGMNVFWWFFWVLMVAVFFGLMAPVPRRRLRDLSETPLDVLKRRYAAGELTTLEFDERRQRLLRDTPAAADPLMPPPSTQPPEIRRAH